MKGIIPATGSALPLLLLAVVFCSMSSAGTAGGNLIFGGSVEGSPNDEIIGQITKPSGGVHRSRTRKLDKPTTPQSAAPQGPPDTAAPQNAQGRNRNAGGSGTGVAIGAAPAQAQLDLELPFEKALTFILTGKPADRFSRAVGGGIRVASTTDRSDRVETIIRVADQKECIAERLEIRIPGTTSASAVTMRTERFYLSRLHNAYMQGDELTALGKQAYCSTAATVGGPPISHLSDEVCEDDITTKYVDLSTMMRAVETYVALYEGGMCRPLPDEHNP